MKIEFRETFAATNNDHSELDLTPKFPILLLSVFHKARPASLSKSQISKSLPS